MNQLTGTKSGAPDLRLLLRDLAESLTGSQSAVLRSNLAELELQTLRLRETCERIQQSHLGATPSAMEDGLIQAAQECRRAARLQKALLKRLQRGLGLLTLFRSSQTVTYQMPPQPEIAGEHKGR